MALPISVWFSGDDHPLIQWMSFRTAASMWPGTKQTQNCGRSKCGCRKLALGSQYTSEWQALLWRVSDQRYVGSDCCYLHHVLPRQHDGFMGLESMSGPNLNKVSRTIDKIIVHPMFNFFIDNNMALLKLSSPVNFTDYIQPVCLASANSTFYTGVSSWVVGFGVISSDGPNADTLQEVRVPVVGNNECKCAYPYYDLTDNMICAGFRSGGNGSCEGDSGGPMMIKKGSVWIQSGVVSYGEGSAYVPEFYARVSQYEDWIKNHTGSSKPGFVDYMSSGVDRDLDFVCPTAYPTTQHPHTTDDGSVFGSGESVTSSLGLLLMSLYVLVGGI